MIDSFKRVLASDSSWFKASKDNDNSLLIKLLHSKSNVNIYDFNGDSPLHIAVQNKNEFAFNLILLAGAKLNSPNWQGETPLLQACKSKFTYGVKHFLKLGVNPNQVSSNGLTPIVSAIYDDNYEISNLLLNYGSNPNELIYVEYFNRIRLLSLLQYSMIRNNKFIVQNLLAHGASIHQRDNQDLSFIDWAMEFDVSYLDLILKSQIKVYKSITIECHLQYLYDDDFTDNNKLLNAKYYF